MREIELPITQTFSVTLDEEDMKNAPLVDMGGGMLAIQLPSVVDDENQKITATARRNGGTVLYATTSIEQKLNQILLNYFMGPFKEHSERRVIFETEVLQSSSLPFNAKKELVLKVLKSEELISGKQRNKLQGHLAKIMVWRNAFAHGRIQYNNKQKCFVKYYSGSPKELILNDDFWDEVELAFRTSDTLLTEAFRAISNPAQES